MRKNIASFSFILVFILSFFLSNSSFGTSTKQDSIARSVGLDSLNLAFDGTKNLSNKDRIRLALYADSTFRKIEDWDLSIVAINMLCHFYQWERAYEHYDRITEDAIHIARVHLKRSNQQYGRALNMRGVAMYDNKRDLHTASKLLKESIKLDKQNKVDPSLTSVTYFNLGTFYLESGDYLQAIEHSNEALRAQLNAKQINEVLMPNIENQLGTCYVNIKQYDRAVEHFENGLKYAFKARSKDRSIDQVVLYLYQNLADLYVKTNKLELAKRYIDLSLDLQAGEEYLKDAYTFQLQGEILLQEKKYKQALQSFQYSTKAAQLEFKDFDKHPDIGITYYHAGNVKSAQNELDSALYFYQLALINNSSNFSSIDPTKNPTLDDLLNLLEVTDILEAKAKTHTLRYGLNKKIADLNAAFDHYQLATIVIDKLRGAYQVEGSKYTLAEKVIPIYEGAIQTAVALYEISKDDKWLEKAFLFAEENKAATLFESIKENEALDDTSIPDSLTDKEYELKINIAFYEQMIHEARQKNIINKEEIDAWVSTLFKLKESYKNLIDYFETNYEKYHALKFKKEEVALKAIQNRLKKSALIEFFVGRQFVFVFTVTASAIYCNQSDKKSDFEKDIKSLRSIITTAPSSNTLSKDLRTFSEKSYKLYQGLLATSIQNIPISTKHVMIVPDDLLAYLPFSILVVNENKKEGKSFKSLSYLSERFGISYNYSASFWLKHLNKTTQLASKRFAGFAPEFSSYPANEKLAALSCNIKEVEQIDLILNSNNSQTAKKATLDNFKRTVSDYQIFHLATHTTLDNENSAFNRIYFSDDYLSQNDLYHLNFNASLAVLSACNTGSGELKKGEGVMSLSRGFTYAGCPSILMSLWSVDDCATADIMKYYYENLNEGQTKELALQDAKKKYLIQTNDILQGHPYYWAAFVQFGDTSAIEFRSSFPWKYLLGGLGLLLFSYLLLNRKSTKKGA